MSARSGSSRSLRWLALSLVVAPLACGGGRQTWIAGAPQPLQTPQGRPSPVVDDALIVTSPPDVVPPETPAQDAATPDVAGVTSARPRMVDLGGDDVFRNTYYDFPREGLGAKDATVFDASCAPPSRGSDAAGASMIRSACTGQPGTSPMGQTVSFARRDCACADVCPRTGQQICFERLDAARFPSGRGATRQPITPLRTVAVDTSVIPLGTPLYVPELAGLPRADGTPHDGCFIAEDRGLKVVGRHIDVFTGDPAMTTQWNGLVPSNRGVHVRIGDPRCAP